MRKMLLSKSSLSAGLSTAVLVAGLSSAVSVHAQTPAASSQENTMTQQQVLSNRQQAIVPVAAYAAAGDMAKLSAALHKSLDAGVTINELKEVLVQLYAYAGFPRSLNALGNLMAVVDARKQRNIVDTVGAEPSQPSPKGDALLAMGHANQTKLVGREVSGALFDFAPAANEYLKTHLFGDIFSRDNLSWQDREVATIAMLAAIPGAEAQLSAHLHMGMNTGLTRGQLQQLADVLAADVNPQIAGRAETALEQLKD